MNTKWSKIKIEKRRNFDYKAKCYSKNEGKDLNTRIDTANSGAPY